MKRIIFSLLFALSAISANAQFHLGGQFSINFDNERTSFSSGASSIDKENAYMIYLKPKVYWNLNENMQIGGRIGFAFGRITNGIVYEPEKKDQTDIINRAVGWSVSPFFGYKLMNWKAVSIWAEANAFVGQYYNVGKPTLLSSEWSRQSEYGFQILPVVDIEIKENLALQIHLGFISLGWYGTKSDYPEKTVTTSSWDMHKGGFAGLIQGFSDYGIGLVKTF